MFGQPGDRPQLFDVSVESDFDGRPEAEVIWLLPLTMTIGIQLWLVD